MNIAFKKKIIWMSLLIIIFVIIVTLFNLSDTTYTISPKLTKAFWGRTPQEFLVSDYDFFPSCEDFNRHGYIDENGNLVLILTERQKIFVKKDIRETIKCAEDVSINVSKDYKSYVFECSAEESSNTLRNFPILLTHRLGMMQILSGEDPDTVSVTIMVRHPETKEITQQIVWPESGVSISQGEGGLIVLEEVVQSGDESFNQSGDGQSGDGSVIDGR